MDDDSGDDAELQVGMIIKADDNTVVKKGTFGKIVSLEHGKEFGLVEWELANLGKPPGTPPTRERIALEGACMCIESCMCRCCRRCYRRCYRCCYVY